MGELLHPSSCECTNTSLDLFAVPPTNSSIENGFWLETHPVSTLTDAGPIEFHIDGGGEEYTDLAESHLHIRAKVVDGTGNDLAADDNVGPINLWSAALFSQVDISLNGTLVSASQNTYPWKAYLETLLSYGRDATETQLALCGYHPDTPGHLDSISGDGNKGFNKRKSTVANSKEVDLICRIHSDLFLQERLLLNGINIKLRLVRSKNSFVLQSDVNDCNFGVKITHASLFVRRCKVNPAIVLAHEKALLRGTVKYPINKVEVKTFSIGKGHLSFVEDHVFTGRIPKRLVIGMVDSVSFNGDYKKNPFNFKHNGLNYLSLYLDGRQIPSRPLTPNFDQNLYARSYFGLFQGVGAGWGNRGPCLSYDDYPKGYTLFCFDLTPTMSENGCGQVELIKSGNLRIEARFQSPLSEAIHVIVYAERDSMIECHRSREIMTDI